MPIILPETSLAAERYRAAGVPVATARRGRGLETRALRILVVNLMPNALETETRLLRLLADSPLQTEVALLRGLDGGGAVGEGGLLDHQRGFDVVRDGTFDGCVCVAARAVAAADLAAGAHAGAGPSYDHFAAFVEWSRVRVRASLFIGWAAEAALGHLHGLLGHWQAEPVVAVVPHRVSGSPLVAAQDRTVAVPLARASRFARAQVEQKPGLEVLVDHVEHGAHLIHEPGARRLYALDHIESSAGMFARALRRRHGADAAEAAEGVRPGQAWRSYAHLLFAEWLSQDVHGAVRGG
jgi:homoserine O-succinyltransferase